MNIIKTHKHISDNTGISNGKKHSWRGGTGECNYKGAAQWGSYVVMDSSVS